MAERLAGFLDGPVFGVTITLVVYALARSLFVRRPHPLLNPVLVSVVVLIALLSVAGIEYRSYQRGAQLISFFLGPSVVALGVPLFRQFAALRKNAPAIVVSMLFAAICGSVAATVPAVLAGSDWSIVLSLAPKSVTTPIAMAIAANIGGVPELTAATVIITGLLAAAIGPVVLRLLGIVEAEAFGIAMGAAGHGLATARALEVGPTAGAFAGLGLCLNGIMTALLTPAVIAALQFVFAG